MYHVLCAAQHAHACKYHVLCAAEELHAWVYQALCAVLQLRTTCFVHASCMLEEKPCASSAQEVQAAESDGCRG
eukprot:scaffold146637_cov27-Tisochrysis_lutea.AAC.1